MLSPKLLVLFSGGHSPSGTTSLDTKSATKNAEFSAKKEKIINYRVIITWKNTFIKGDWNCHRQRGVTKSDQRSPNPGGPRSSTLSQIIKWSNVTNFSRSQLVRETSRTWRTVGPPGPGFLRSTRPLTTLYRISGLWRIRPSGQGWHFYPQSLFGEYFGTLYPFTAQLF